MDSKSSFMRIGEWTYEYIRLNNRDVCPWSGVHLYVLNKNDLEASLARHSSEAHYWWSDLERAKRGLPQEEMSCFREGARNDSGPCYLVRRSREPATNEWGECAP